MKRTATWMVRAFVLVTGGAVLWAAVQDRTLQPGQPTQGKVWIQNRGETEAVPVSIQTGASGPPLRAQIIGIPTVTTGGGVVNVRLVPQTWEYRSVTIASGQDPAMVVGPLGADGWETTALTMTDQRGTVVVLKRPSK
jgi:hypothetical protein